MRLIATAALALLASASLTACNPPASAGQVATTVDTDLPKATVAFGQAKAMADLFLPLLPADKVAVIQQAETIVGTALAAARAAATVADRNAEIDRANAATNTINAATGATS